MTLASEALDTLSPEVRRKVYVILNLTVEASADGGSKISGAFGEEPVLGGRRNVKTFLL